LILFQIQGGYSLVLMTNKKLVGVRDPFGIRPLVIGKLKNSIFLHQKHVLLILLGQLLLEKLKMVK
jgi:amidophosphoribosyltransferase